MTREQSSMGNYEAPKFAVQRAAQLRRDLRDTKMLVRNRADVALEEEVYMEAIAVRHINIGDCRCRELHKHLR